MDFESPDVEKEFPGLYASESSRRSDSDYGDSTHERGGKKELLRSKKKEKKEKNKDKGYAALGEDSSLDEMDPLDTRSPLKPKKQKSFKFLHKREKEEKEERKEEKKKEKEERKIDKRKEKEKEKEERRREKEEKKKVKKEKKKKHDEPDEEELAVFGVPLSEAVQRCPAHDGIQLPAIVRECIDQIEERGLHCEGIYRLSGVKSKVQHLRHQYNTGEAVRLMDHEPHVIASLLKQYLRELPEPVLTVDMMPHFEDVAMIPNPGERAEAMRQLIDRLPTANRLLLQYMFKHMGHIIAREADTKMTYQNVSIVLSPTMQISHRVLNVLFLNHSYLFGGVVIKKYIPPIGSGVTERTVDQLRTVAEIEAEMMKQESLLGHLHAQVAAGNVTRRKEESLWEAQRIVTLLKRKLRSAQRREDDEKQRKQGSMEQRKVELAEKESTSEESQREHEGEEDTATSFKTSGTALVSDDSSKQEGSERSERSERSDRVERGDSLGQQDTTTITTTSANTNNVTVMQVEDVPSGGEQEGVSVVPCHAIPVLPKPATHTDRSKVTLSREPCVEAEDSVDVAEQNQEEEETKVEDEVDEGVVREEDKTEEIVEEGLVKEDKPQDTVNVSASVEELAPPPAPHVTVIKVVPGTVPGGASVVPREGQGSSVPPVAQGPAAHWPEVKRPTAEVPFLDDSGLKDSEHLALLAKEALLVAEHGELLSMNHDLMRKLQAEHAEIKRLREEIQEMQTLYGYRTYSYDSSESEGSESDGESDTEEDMLNWLSMVTKANRELQEENHSLTHRIQEEREAVIQMRVKLQEAQWKGYSHDTPVTPIC
ncbi:hypothetical protein O3P69_012100 [Scylla paramamosain]|uniref:Rho-GAP domain-containing protein n=2 Tax=Scylla paramamosain TaxID=85552 RepID=A0AAW0TD33_SCYPA